MDKLKLMQRPVGQLETRASIERDAWLPVSKVVPTGDAMYHAYDSDGKWRSVDANGVSEWSQSPVVRLRQSDTPALDEWESAIEGETLVDIVRLPAPSPAGHTQLVIVLLNGGASSYTWHTDSSGSNGCKQIIRRKPQTTTINFDRPSFAATGAQFIAIGKPGEQPPKESVWIRGDIDEVGVFFNDSSRRVHMSWSELAARWVHTSDHGATWHAFTRTVTKGGQS
jgi:hypothetical protein